MILHKLPYIPVLVFLTTWGKAIPKKGDGTTHWGTQAILGKITNKHSTVERHLM